jgi:SAM-dependent methyltransferase
VTPSSADQDASNGWEACAEEFIRGTREPHVAVGVREITEWVDRLPALCTVLDLACGPGGPRSEPLHTRGTVYAIDASRSLAHAYQERFPTAHVVCEPAEGSTLFDRRFDGILAWGLLFLLTERTQEAVIRRVAQALEPGGSFLFTAPWQRVTWADNSTGRASLSLGRDRYRELLDAAGLSCVREYEDEGGNHYYESSRR